MIVVKKIFNKCIVLDQAFYFDLVISLEIDTFIRKLYENHGSFTKTQQIHEC